MQVTIKSGLSKLAEYARHRANPSSNQLLCPSEYWFSGYTPTYLTHVTQVFADRKVDLLLIVYLPYLSYCSVDYVGEPQQSCNVQVKVNNKEVAYFFVIETNRTDGNLLLHWAI
jgi:hypothetical protein